MSKYRFGTFEEIKNIRNKGHHDQHQFSKNGGVVASLVSILALSHPAKAVTLFGNYSSTNDGLGTTISATTGTRGKAIGFTLPVSTDYTLDSVSLRLVNYNTTAGDVVQLQIYRDSAKASNSPLGTTPESLTFNNPSSASDAVGNFNFTPTTNFTFLADTRYWLLMTVPSGSVGWRANSPSVAPTGISGMGYNGYVFTNNGVSYANSTLLNSFQINATPVPFESNAAPAGMAIVFGAFMLRRRLQQRSAQKMLAESVDSGLIHEPTVE
ncbi:choice-of-anchor R domain-containing protein [Aphanizomenon sp. UHCC 0183]|uniref:choice-of-anchor R domain-containing protein n=1 Tax=Aphanizomenon sp. UHCC 0183 TaxID=2590028 RepID=UPI001446F334|nr:choice-of-anchor R domain-containing protein [Aphanizomenon sp. UHCC 0183]MTJ28548.1 hypothetical protein [Aphanizomenon sp. UHCC 0183]